MFTRKKNVLALALAASAAAQADEILRPVTVVATRIATASEEVAATVTSLERREIQRRLPADLADLLNDEPDVAVARDLRRFGSTRVNLRGVEDQRVTQMVDGVRLPDFYNSGGPSNFTMSAPLLSSLAFLKRVEILRGPASSLYGSDALAGVLGYLTLAPGDLLAQGETMAVQYSLGYSGANHGLSHSLLGAWRGADVEALLGYTRSTAGEFDNRGELDVVGANRSRPNPQDLRDHGVLAKLALHPAAGHRLALTLEGRAQDNEVSVLRLAAALPKVTSVQGRDHTQRLRTSVEWEHRPRATFYDRLTARVYHQESDTHNFNRQDRSNTGASCSAVAGSGNRCVVEQDFLFSQASLGATAQFESAFTAAGTDHLLTYGVDLARVNTAELRDALLRNLSSGTSSKSLAGDSYPLRDFAPGRSDTLGIFVQDEIAGLAGGALTLSPGLRYDWRRLSPHTDALAQQVLSAIQRSAIEQSAAAVSPKLGALWRITPSYALYGQLASGFRAPNYEEVNGAFRNAAQRYGSSPNPDLKPETSVGLELGVKAQLAKLRGQLSYYDNRYRHFIENVRLNCPSDPRCLAGLATTYLHQNQSRARIHGAEARAAWDAAPGWKADGALAWAQGENRASGQPLNSIEPARISLGLSRDAGNWGAQARLRAARAVTRTDDSNGVWFRPAGYGVSDLTLWWQPAARVQVNLAVNNLFDKKYWLWSDIRQADAPNPAGVDFYTQAGRNLALSLKISL
ncbi:MAG: TonB-dependent hemoglobin/transferrin/lactoferrin family receptor [Burkholderiales bacterium]|nr:TonB-dependent hemoglobin/transferrin/lactoferrin family receptor [Burkholderiales bacterium]